MNERRDNFPRPSDFPRLADAYSGDGFPEHGPWTPLSAAVLADALEALKESRGLITAEDGLCRLCGQGTFMRVMHLTTGTTACPESEQEQRRARQAQTRAAKEIGAAWHDPHWLDEH